MFEKVRTSLAMVHKLRKEKGNRDSRYTLESMIEMDEGYFTVDSLKYRNKKEKQVETITRSKENTCSCI